MELTVKSRKEMEKLWPNDLHITISFKDPGTDNPKLQWNKNRLASLVIEVEDLDDVKLAKEMGRKIFTEDQADTICNFVNEWKDQVNHIVVNCEGGICRSSGCAAAISKILNGDDFDIFNNPRFIPNMHIYRMILRRMNQIS